MKLYHGTPFIFTELRAGSWLAASKEQASVYLMLKNAKLDVEDLLEGFILEVEVPDDAESSIDFEHIEPMGYFLSHKPIPVSRENFLLLKDEIQNFEGRLSSAKSVTHVMDLTDLIRQ